MQNRVFFFFTTILFCTNCLGQALSQKNPNQFYLKGYISDMDSGSIILHYLDIDSKLKIDTSAISKGQFYFKGSIKEPTYATLNFPDYRQVFGDMNVANLFLEPKVITASFSSHKLNSGVYTGSATQDLYSGFLAGENKIALKWKAVMDEHSKLLAEYSNENIGTQREKEIDQRLEELSPKIQQYNKEIEDLQYQYIVENPGNYVSAFLLCQFQQRPELDFVKKIYPTEANFFLIKVENPIEIYEFLLAQNILTSLRHPQIENALRINVGSKEENQKLIETLKNYQ